ncbi:MAG TPA: hypothetical protein VMV69_25850 [Pirellulales bacterium]|nr:hypothetical protein [Pirellulales bacterium]
MRAYQIAFLSWLWLLGAIVPAAAQDEVPAAAQDDQKPTAKQATAPVEDVSPVRKRTAAVPQSLEQAMAQALRTNPEMLIAVAKVRVMHAELNQMRMAVARDVTMAYHKWENAKKNLSRYAQAGLAVISASDLRAAKQALDEGESELMYLLWAGVGADSDDDESAATTEGSGLAVGPAGGITRMSMRDVHDQPAERPEIPERYREVMNKKVPELAFDSQPLSDCLDVLREATEGEVSFVFKEPQETPPQLNLFLHKVTVASTLEALADQTGFCFVFRDYGVLVVRREDAWQYRGAAIPSDTPLTMPGGKAGVRR